MNEFVKEAKEAYDEACREIRTATWAVKYGPRLLAIADMATDEDWLAEQVRDSLDYDWGPLDAARMIATQIESQSENDL